MKRVYSEDGTKSAPAWFVFGMWALCSPWVLSYIFIRRVLSEAVSGFKYAWLDVREEVASVKRHWHNIR